MNKYRKKPVEVEAFEMTRERQRREAALADGEGAK